MTRREWKRAGALAFSVAAVSSCAESPAVGWAETTGATRARSTPSAAERRDRADLEARMVDALERADTSSAVLRERATRAAARERRTLDRVISDAERNAAKLRVALRRLRGELGESWEAFEADVEATLHDLDRTLANAR